ncbi:MAG: carbohydrate binding domain-containing protein, partial [Fibrobacter sp.]|nr:carbohydrate binding domain-containing protein [Fibrobacter sp.]
YCDTSIEVINLGFNDIDTLPFEIKMSPRSSSGLPTTDLPTTDTPTTVLPGAFELIDDFEDGDSISKRNTKWYTAKDFSYEIAEYDELTGEYKFYNESTKITANLAVPEGANSSGKCASVTYTIGQDYEYNEDGEQGAGLGVDLYADFSDSKCRGISFYHKGDSMRVKIGLPLVETYKARDFLVEKSDKWRLVTLSWADFLNYSSLQCMPDEYLNLVSRIIFGFDGNEGENGTFYIDDIKLINEPIKPIIVKQPYYDYDEVFIEVLGKPVACQWQKDGVNIGAYSSSHWSCSFYGAGTYRCIVTNSAGSVVSEPVIITEDMLW